MSSPHTPVTAVVFLDSGATGFTTDSSAPVSSMKSMFWSPAFKVTVGSRGPDISEPWQPYLISKPASPTTGGASSSFLALGHSFFQWPKARHWAHWFWARGLCWDQLKDCPVPGAQEVFGGPERDFPRAAASIANLLSVLFRSLQGSGRAQSLLNSNISLPFLSVLTGRGRYSLGSLAGAGSWKCWPEVSLCHLPRWWLYDLRESSQRSSGCCRTSPGPGSGIKAASSPGGALGGRSIIIQYGGGGRSSPSKSCRISFFIISQFLCH